MHIILLKTYLCSICSFMDIGIMGEYYYFQIYLYLYLLYFILFMNFISKLFQVHIKYDMISQAIRFGSVCFILRNIKYMKP